MSKSKINQRGGVRGSTGDANLPPRVPPPSSQRWAMGFAAATAPFADPARVDVMLRALAPLLANGASVRFSNHTGLVRTLRGRLWPPRVTNPDQALGEADAFLHQHQAALFGNDQNQWIPAERPVVGAAACFRQVAPDGIPVYGAIVSCDYDSTGRLRMLTSNWYPLPPKTRFLGALQFTRYRDVVFRPF